VKVATRSPGSRRRVRLSILCVITRHFRMKALPGGRAAGLPQGLGNNVYLLLPRSGSCPTSCFQNGGGDGVFLQGGRQWPRGPGSPGRSSDRRADPVRLRGIGAGPAGAQGEPSLPACRPLAAPLRGRSRPGRTSRRRDAGRSGSRPGSRPGSRARRGAGRRHDDGQRAREGRADPAALRSGPGLPGRPEHAQCRRSGAQRVPGCRPHPSREG